MVSHSQRQSFVALRVMGSQLLVRSFSRHGYAILLRHVDEVGEVILPKSSVGGGAVNASAIIMAFIGVGLSMFSLSRLQNSSERRALSPTS